MVGFPKAGTSSIQHFFKCGGWKTHHGGNLGKSMQESVKAQRDPLSGFTAQVYTQMDGNCYFPQIDALGQLHTYHPNSTFILNLRNVQHWIQSVKNWGDLAERWCACVHTTPSFSAFCANNTQPWEALYEHHIKRIVNFTLHHLHHLVVVDIEADWASAVMSATFHINQTCWTDANSRLSQSSAVG